MIEFIAGRWFLILMLFLDFVGMAGVLVILKKPAFKVWQAILIAAIGVPVGVVFAMFGAFAMSGFSLSSWGEISVLGPTLLFWIYGLAVALIAKRDLKDCLDCFAILLILSLSLTRINCFYSGCCLGKYVDASQQFRYPTREIELGFNAVFMIVLFALFEKGKTKGFGYPSYMIGYGLFRFVSEFFREADPITDGSVFHSGHVGALTSVFLGIAGLLLVRYLPLNKPKTDQESAEVSN